MSDSSNLQELYKQVILDHYRSPRNRGELTDPSGRAVGFNPLCGDEVIVTLATDGDTISDIKIAGNGCSISQSAASMMSAAVKGKPIANARQLSDAFKQMMSVHEQQLESDDNTGDRIQPGENLGDLEALRGVVKFPVRIKCALLSWNTLLEALDADKNKTS